MKHRPIALLSVLLITIAVPAAAQDNDSLTNDQREMLGYVNGAYENLNHLDSYAIHYFYEIFETIAYEDGDTYDSQNGLSLDAQGQFDADGNLAASHGNVASYVDVRQRGDDERPDTDIESEFILTDARLYERTDLPLADALDLTDEEAATFEEMWLALSYDDLLSLTSLDLGQDAFRLQMEIMPVVSPMIDSQFHITGFQPPLFEESSVLDIIELENKVLDGQTMRVFEVMLDPFPLIWGHYNQSVVPWRPPNPVETFGSETYYALQLYFRDSYRMGQQIWIGETDHLPHRMIGGSQGAYMTKKVRETIPELMDSEHWPRENITFISSSYSTLTYTDFNTPFTIEAPSNTISLMDFLNPEGDPSPF